MDVRGLRILHTSDWQCGKPFVPSAAEALVRLGEELSPDLVVASGDLTQRAKHHEYRTAVALLRRFGDRPVVTTPGNHDVPLYRFWERMVVPFGKWRRYVDTDLDTVTRVHGATVVTLCSAAPRRAIVNGRLSERQLDFAARAFAGAAEDDVRVLVVHHHFVPVPDGEGGHPLPRARRWVARIEDMGVDVVLGGHVHQTHIATSTALSGSGDDEAGVPIVACGTSTSRRGRGAEAGVNSAGLVRVTADAVEVTPYVLEPGENDFVATEPRALRRRPATERRAGVADGSMGGGVR